MNNIVIVRGGGDLASGTILKLHRSGFRVLVLEVENPSCIRRTVSFGEAVHEGKMTLEGETSVHVLDLMSIYEAWESGQIPVYVDEHCKILRHIEPIALIDAIIAKKNLGTSRSMAPVTIALGPGFTAGVDVDIVIETSRGHHLGRLIFDGMASENTGIPGIIAGYGRERVIYSAHPGTLVHRKKIGDIVRKGEVIATIGHEEVRATLDGVLRGLLREGYEVPAGFKIADIDPRIEEVENCFTISDKASALGGAALEAVLLGARHKGYQLQLCRKMPISEQAHRNKRIGGK